jgi:DNA-binding NarL/FixJ family response regulator
MSRPKVIVIDDSTLVREGLPLVQDSVEVVAGYQTIEPVLQDRPTADLVILDLHLGTPDEPRVRQGRVAIEALTEAGYRVCIFTSERRRYVLAACIQSGAVGVVHKTDSIQQSAELFVRAAAGEVIITPTLVGLAEVLERGGRLPELTQRQRTILAGRARGESWRELGARLYITEDTCRDHMKAITKKVGDYFHSTTPGDIERDLGLSPGDLFDSL